MVDYVKFAITFSIELTGSQKEDVSSYIIEVYELIESVMRDKYFVVRCHNCINISSVNEI